MLIYKLTDGELILKAAKYAKRGESRDSIKWILQHRKEIEEMVSDTIREAASEILSAAVGEYLNMKDGGEE